MRVRGPHDLVACSGLLAGLSRGSSRSIPHLGPGFDPKSAQILNKPTSRMSDRDGKENLNQALNLPRPSSQPMGIHAPFKKPTLSFKPPVINQPAKTMQIHTSKAARPSNSTAVAPKSNSSSSQRYRVVFLPFEDYAKKKKIRKWQDGFLEIAMGTSTLWSEVITS